MKNIVSATTTPRPPSARSSAPRSWPRRSSSELVVTSVGAAHDADVGRSVGPIDPTDPPQTHAEELAAAKRVPGRAGADGRLHRRRSATPRTRSSSVAQRAQRRPDRRRHARAELRRSGCSATASATRSPHQGALRRADRALSPRGESAGGSPAAAPAERRILTTCPRDCYDACGVEVAVRDGRSATSAATRTTRSAAGSCAASARPPTTACSSTRRRGCSRRCAATARKGERRASTASWEEALGEIAARLRGSRRRRRADDPQRPLHRDLRAARLRLSAAVLPAARRDRGRSGHDLQQRRPRRARLPLRDLARRLRPADRRATPRASSCGGRTRRPRRPTSTTTGCRRHRRRWSSSTRSGRRPPPPPTCTCSRSPAATPRSRSRCCT